MYFNYSYKIKLKEQTALFWIKKAVCFDLLFMQLALNGLHCLSEFI